MRAIAVVSFRIRGRRWPVIVLLVAALVTVILWMVEDQDVLVVRSPVAAEDARYVEYVASLLGAPVSRGDHYRVLQNGDAIFPAMLAAIEGARRRISFESFIYDDGEVSARFTEALAAAARRGVSVRIVLDAFGSMGLPRDSVRQLEDAGVQVVWFNPFRSHSVFQDVNYRTHRKVLVVDGSLGFTGGVGLADHWLGNAQGIHEWRDTQFGVTGPAVRALEASFYENWIESGGQEAPALDAEDPPQGTGARSIVLWSNYMDGASNVKMLYLLAIAGARRTIDIQSPYFITDASTGGALEEARRRGVRVRVVTDGDSTDAKSVKRASRASYQRLLDQGFEIYEFQPTMMHVKAMVVDGVWSVFGSANFDNRSLELNDELQVAVADRDLAAELTRAFEADIARSLKLDAQTWRQRPLYDKVRERFWSLFSEFF